MNVDLLNRLSIKQRITVGISTIIFIMVLLVSSALVSLDSVEQQADEISSLVVPTMAASADLMAQLTRSAQYLGYYLLGGENDYRTRYQEDFRDAGQTLEQLERLLEEQGQHDEETFSSIRRDFELFASNMEKIDGLVGSRSNNDPAMLQAAEKINPVEQLVERIRERIASIVEQERRRLDAANDTLLERIGNSRSTMLLLMVLALVVGGLVAWSSSRQVARLVDGLGKAFNNLAEGNFTFRTELGNSAEAKSIGASLEQFCDCMQDTIGRLQLDARQLDSAAGQLSQVICDASQASQTQDVETEHVVLAMNEMASTVQEIARSAETAATTAHEANSEARSGALVATEAIGGIDVLAREVATAATVIEKLQQECGSIGSVLDVIRGIAEQTNLLALNAAIEAARAGEQGRGFAVVADEVRSLASRTQQSTTEIQQMIERLQAGAADAVNVMGDARQGARNSSDQVERAAESLAGIAASVAQVNDLITRIASATEEQSVVGAEIKRNVESINGQGEQRNLRSRDMNAANDNLQGVAQELHDLTARFRV